MCLKQTGIPVDKLIKLGAIYVKKSTDFKPRRIFFDIDLVIGDEIRIHPYPRFYPTHDINWKDVIIEKNNDYIVIDKPSGIPSNPMLCNFYENVFECIKSEMNYGDDELFLPHRLDTDTSGKRCTFI